MTFLLFTGSCGAGKSTLARAVGDTFGIPVIEERQVVRGIAGSRGFRRSRDWLFSTTLEEVEKAALAETLRLIHQNAVAAEIIIDGFYDPGLLPKLKSEFPNSRMYVMAVEADENTRLQRVMAREELTVDEAIAEIKLLDGLKEMVGMGRLISEATLRIDNNRPLDEVVKEIQPRLESEIFTRPSGPERMRG